MHHYVKYIHMGLESSEIIFNLRSQAFGKHDLLPFSGHNKHTELKRKHLSISISFDRSIDIDIRYY